jgi:hypothetical protein
MSEHKETPAPAVALTIEQLTAIIAEIRKPAAPTEAQQKKLDQEQDMRRQTAETDAEVRANNARMQKMCGHIRRDGTARTVFVKPHGRYEPIGYILCQKCRAVIRPETAKRGSAVPTIYDTALFNRLFQMTAGTSSAPWSD